jgi:5-methylcytosine-specific restriction endonuclease McrA
MSGHCELCGRTVPALTKHHLIPKARHTNKRNQRDFDRHEVKHRLAWFCRPCHNHVHALFTEKALEREFNTLALLAAHPEVAKFVAWIRGKPDGFKPTSYASNGKRDKLESNAPRW